MIPWEQLIQDSLFKDWQKQHQHAFLTHLFCQLNSDLKIVSNWEIGYFNPATDKITVFVVNDKVEIKPEDKVFKKPESEIENLELNRVKISFEQTVEIFKKGFAQHFPKAERSGGFLILQTIDRNILWNFTFVDKRLKFLNLKINAESGRLEDYREIELVQNGEKNNQR